MLAATADEPLSLTSLTRSFVADSITPISAYLALAQPGRSCLLESVEGTERISRFSFIGIDYLESFAIDRDPQMLEKLRGALRRYSLDRTDLPFPGGAVCAFTYDAARALEPVLHRAQAERRDAAGRRAVRGRAGRHPRDLAGVRPLHPPGPR